MSTTAPDSSVTSARRSPILLPVLVGAIALGLVAALAFDGPGGLLGLAAMTTVLLAAPLLLGAAYLGLWILPALGLTILLGQISRGIHAFELVYPAVIVAGLIATLHSPDRRAWDVRLPGWIGFAFLAVPLLALPGVVVARSAYLAAYKFPLLWVLLFFCLRRLVPPERSRILLWIFPLIGVAGALQLLWKTRGLGAFVFSRLEFRNFYTRLPWGQSDYISATMEFCLCMTFVLFLLERGWTARVLLVLAALPMIEAFLMLFSRAGAIGLVAFILILALGMGGRRGIAAALLGSAGLAAAAFTPGGQVFLHRFTDPGEYASWYVRLLYWQFGWERFIHHPWTGIGLNQGKSMHDLMGDKPSNNLFLDTMSEQGILGGILLAIILFAAYRMAWRVRPVGFDAPVHPVRVALVATLTQVLIHAMVEPTISGPTIAIPFVYLLAWLALQREPMGKGSA